MRKENKVSGISEFEINRRKKRNKLSFGYNTVIWVCESVAMLAMVKLWVLFKKHL